MITPPQPSSQTKPSPSGLPASGGGKLGVALVGLGKYSTEQLAPALLETEYCRLAGIVTGTPEKTKQWVEKYSLDENGVYDYQNFDSIANNPDIDIVYVVLPNALHAEFVIRAAQAGKHVICEKPMGLSVEECEDMIRACQDADRLLSIGYRLHFEPHNLEMARLGREEVFGSVRKITAADEIPIEENVWRLDKEMAGGGPVMDVGIYCVQGAVYTVGKSPIAVTAGEGKKTDPEKFRGVEESMSWTLEFEGGVTADCRTSYGGQASLLHAEAEQGYFELNPAYDYSGLSGRTSNGVMAFSQPNQQARQMDDFAVCILSNKVSRVPGEMGLRDVRILSAIYESAERGERVLI